MKTTIFFFCLSFLFVGCKKNKPEDFSVSLLNKEIEITVGSRTVKAYLSKPEGEILDMVLVLHGGTLNYESSVNATINQATKLDGGKQFLENGYAILSLEYTEFAGPSDTDGVPKGIMEMEDVLATVDFLQASPFLENGFTISRLIAFGHSRGGANALLAGIERNLSAVVSAEGPLNWKAVRDSIASGFLAPTPDQLINFHAGTAAWNADTALWTTYSPALRLEEFNCPFMVIAGELDEATFQDMAIQMEANYDACGTCVTGSEFILHPNGHTDWANAAILTQIKTFIGE